MKRVILWVILLCLLYSAGRCPADGSKLETRRSRLPAFGLPEISI